MVQRAYGYMCRNMRVAGDVGCMDGAGAKMSCPVVIAAQVIISGAAGFMGFFSIFLHFLYTAKPYMAKVLRPHSHVALSFSSQTSQVVRFTRGIVGHRYNIRGSPETGELCNFYRKFFNFLKKKKFDFQNHP